MAVLTLPVRHAYAADYKSQLETKGCWMCLGRTTPWENEEEPPVPSPTATAVEEPTGYKKVSMVSFVQKDPAGTIIYLGEKYKKLTDEEAEAASCILICVKGVFEYDELPAVTTRQLGIFCGLTPATGHETDIALTPSEVASTGRLDVIDNTIPNTRADYQRDEYTYMIQF